VSYKADQNWVKVSANKEMLIFPGGGTQFKNGATHYINFIQEVRSFYAVLVLNSVPSFMTSIKMVNSIDAKSFLVTWQLVGYNRIS
jgi:hypothetical protein